MRVTFDPVQAKLPNREAAKRVILDIVAAKGGRFQRKVLLFKAFYLAHLYYWVDHTGVLTDYPIVRMPHGPGIDDGDVLLQELVEEGLLARTMEPFGPYHCEVFSLLQPYEIDPNDGSHDAILKALTFIGNKTAAQVSQEIHEWSRSWREGSNGDTLNIYLDLLSDEEIACVREATAATRDSVSAAFGT